jgi:hypothetical protein
MFGELGGDAGGGQHGGLMSAIIPIVIVVAIVVLRNSRPRKLKVDRLWVYPLILMLMLIAALSAAPPPVTAPAIGILVLALAIGVAIGWQRGRLTHITLDPATQELTAKASPIAIALILAVFLLRNGLGDYLRLGGQALDRGLVTAIGDGLVVLGVAMMSTQRVEMWIRASRMLGRAGAKAGGRSIG